MNSSRTDNNFLFRGGLEVIHLPGHTVGHCGFYSAKHNLLFSGDMMASYFFNAHKPWPIFNSAPELLPASAEKIRQSGRAGFFPFILTFWTAICTGDGL